MLSRVQQSAAAALHIKSGTTLQTKKANGVPQGASDHRPADMSTLNGSKDEGIAATASLSDAEDASSPHQKEVEGLLSAASEGKPAEAQLALRRLLQGNGGDPWLHLALSRVCLELGRTAAMEAVSSARDAVRLAEGQHVQLKVAAQVSLGIALAFASRSMPAKVPVSSRGAMLEEAAEALSWVANEGKANALALYNLALIKALQQKPDDALSIVRDALSQRGQELPAAWALLALLLSARGQYEVAFSAVSAAVAHAEPQMLRLLLRIQANLHLATGDCAEALRTLSRLMVHESLHTPQDEAEDWLHLAEAFLVSRQTADAAECIERARKLTPLSARLWVTEGLFKQHLNKPDSAQNSFEAALATDPEEWRAHLLLGILYCRRCGPADTELAHFHLTSGLLHQPQQSEGWFYLGKVHEAQQSADAAEECFRKACELKACEPVLPYEELPFVPSLLC